jgi:hypothetical protein
MRTIYAYFPDPDLAERATGALLDHGAQPGDISLVHHESHIPDDQSSDRVDLTHPAIRQTTPGFATGSPVDDGPSSAEQANGGKRDGGADQMSLDTASPGAVEDTSRAHSAPPGVTETGVARSEDLKRNERMSVEHFGATTPVEDLTEADAPSLRKRGEVAFPENDPRSTSHGERSGQERDERVPDLMAKVRPSPTTGADAGAGAVKGGAIGLGVGALAAMTTLFIPGVGWVIGGGALAAALGGAAAVSGAGAAAGAVYGYFKDQGIREDAAQGFDRRFRAGGSILAVHMPSGAAGESKIRQLLEKYGGEELQIHDSNRTDPGYMA